MVVEVLLHAREPFVSAGQRYGLVDRFDRVGARHGVGVVAWGFDERRLRILLDGSEAGIARTLVGVRRGSSRLRVEPAHLAVTSEGEVGDLVPAVIRCHRMPGLNDPLESPWSSHRDLLAVRHAAFFDASRLRASVDPRALHWAAGGRALPPGWPPDPGVIPLPRLLRISAAVLGVLPADRRCFRLFAHAARSAGYDAHSIGGALTLTPRRVRQLWAAQEPALLLALQHLADPRLSRVP